MKEEKKIQLARRIDELPPYLFGIINKLKTEKRRLGEDVIDLGMGNPVDPPPRARSSKSSARWPGTPKPRMLILNYPHNRTAAPGSRELFAEVVRLANKIGFWVVHDFAHAKIAFDGYQPPSFMSVPGALDVEVEFGSFSKTFNMAGWRLGYCVGHRDIIAAPAKIKGYYDYGVFSAIQVAGIIALRDCEKEVERQAEIYQQRRDILSDGLARMGWDAPKPKAGMFVWARLPEPFKSMGPMNFSLELVKRAGVVVAPGIGFGSEGEACPHRPGGKRPPPPAGPDADAAGHARTIVDATDCSVMKNSFLHRGHRVKIRDKGRFLCVLCGHKQNLPLGCK